MRSGGASVVFEGLWHKWGLFLQGWVLFGSVSNSTQTIGEVEFIATTVTAYQGAKAITDGSRLRINLKWTVTFTGDVVLECKAGDSAFSVTLT